MTYYKLMVITILSLILGVSMRPSLDNTLVSVSSQNLDTVQYVVYEVFEKLEADHFHSEDQNVKVINFWATWCGPCVKELPFFEALNQKDNNLDVVLVSLDFKNQLKRRLDPFLEKNKITTEVVVLLDGDANKWINMVDPSWSGTIPATLFIKGEQRIFVEQEFHSTQEIYEIINQLK